MGREVMVHCMVLPRGHWACRRICQTSSPWTQNHGGRKLQGWPFGTGRIRARWGDCCGFRTGDIGGLVSALPFTPTPLDPLREDVEHGMAKEGDVVPDGLHPGGRFPSLQENVRMGPQSQLRSLLNPWWPSQIHPEGTCLVPRAANASPPSNPWPPRQESVGYSRPSNGQYPNTIHRR